MGGSRHKHKSCRQAAAAKRRNINYLTLCCGQTVWEGGGGQSACSMQTTQTQAHTSTHRQRQREAHASIYSGKASQLTATAALASQSL